MDELPKPLLHKQITLDPPPLLFDSVETIGSIYLIS